MRKILESLLFKQTLWKLFLNPLYILFLLEKIDRGKKISSFTVVISNNMKFYFSISRALIPFFCLFFFSLHFLFCLFDSAILYGGVFSLFTWRTFLLKSVFKTKGTFLPFCLSAVTPPLWEGNSWYSRDSATYAC